MRLLSLAKPIYEINLLELTKCWDNDRYLRYFWRKMSAAWELLQSDRYPIAGLLLDYSSRSHASVDLQFVDLGDGDHG